AQRVRAVTGRSVTAICRTLGVARRTAYHAPPSRPPGSYRRADDPAVLQQIRAVTNSRGTYGYRRVWAMVNRTFRASYNSKRIRRLMRMHVSCYRPGSSAGTASRCGPREDFPIMAVDREGHREHLPTPARDQEAVRAPALGRRRLLHLDLMRPGR